MAQADEAARAPAAPLSLRIGCRCRCRCRTAVNRFALLWVLVEILVLCTANQCRSPMMQVLLAEQLRARAVASHVGSAGFLAGGLPAAAHARTVVSERGLSLDGHTSRTVNPALLAAADLVVTMERTHVQTAVLLERQCWPRCFSLGELLHRAQHVGPRADDEPLETWVSRLHAGRRPEDVVGGSRTGDVADPMGGPLRRFRATAAELSVAVDALTHLMGPAQHLRPHRQVPAGWHARLTRLGRPAPRR